MSDWWLSKSGRRLMKQVDLRWPDRDHASDGAKGDDAHAQRPSDHNPSESSTPPGVVRAIDIDADLGPPGAMQRLFGQLANCAKTGRDGGRLAYLIYDGQIASGTYQDTFWKPRPFDGDPHTNHLHVSFTSVGDHKGIKFDLPAFRAPGRIRRRIKYHRRQISQLLRRLARIT